jgi:hypothetical protein
MEGKVARPPMDQHHYTRSMLDKALRLTFRNYSTLFLLVGAFSFTASLIYCFFFRAAIAVGELHDTILSFPGKKQVAGVGHDTLVTARLVGWAVVLLGVLALPLLARCARRALERDAGGHAPTVLDSLRHSPGAVPPWWPNYDIKVVGVSVLIALVVGWLALQTGLRLSELLSDGRMWVGVGLARGVAWAVATPFVLVPWALSSRPDASL